MESFDRTTQDVGNIVGLEHVNLLIDDRDLADRFWVSALGFTRDAYVDLGMYGNMWVNLGGQQMHLPTGDPQCFRGAIGLAVPDPDAVEERVTTLLDRFPPAHSAGVAVRRVDDVVEVTAPGGSIVRAHTIDDLAWFGRVGMAYVEVDVERGAVAGVARFYEQMLDAPTAPFRRGAVPGVEVLVGRHQRLRFIETETDLAPYDGHHIAIYLHNFSRPYTRLLDRGLISQESNAHEYRFIDIVDPETGRVCAQLEHEVRSMFHPMYGRELVNRDVSQGAGGRYRPGHDARAGLHHSGVG